MRLCLIIKISHKLNHQMKHEKSTNIDYFMPPLYSIFDKLITSAANHQTFHIISKCSNNIRYKMDDLITIIYIKKFAFLSNFMMKNNMTMMRNIHVIIRRDSNVPTNCRGYGVYMYYIKLLFNAMTISIMILLVREYAATSDWFYV